MKALYHQSTGPLELDVLGKVEGDKADLGREGKVLVAGCPVAEGNAVGTCTLIKPPAKGKKEGKQPTAEEKAAALAEAKKQLAAFEEALAKDPANVDLNKRTEELRAAVEDLES
jgi:hypothetical protein